MVEKLLNLPYEERIVLMENVCVDPKGHCLDVSKAKCISCWEKLVENYLKENK